MSKQVGGLDELWQCLYDEWLEETDAFKKQQNEQFLKRCESLRREIAKLIAYRQAGRAKR